MSKMAQFVLTFSLNVYPKKFTKGCSQLDKPQYETEYLAIWNIFLRRKYEMNMAQTTNDCKYMKIICMWIAVEETNKAILAVMNTT